MPYPHAARTRLSARVILPFYLLALGWIVFAPAQDASHVTGVVAWAANALGGIGIAVHPAYVTLEFLANITLFIPFGALIAVAFTRVPWWAITAIGCATSVTIELIQLALPTRYTTVSDVIANTLGAAVGAVLILLLRRTRRGTPSRGR